MEANDETSPAQDIMEAIQLLSLAGAEDKALRASLAREREDLERSGHEYLRRRWPLEDRLIHSAAAAAWARYAYGMLYREVAR